jgi:hypothetical protein
MIPSSRTQSTQPVSHHPIASQNILSSGNTINNNFNLNNPQPPIVSYQTNQLIVNNIMQVNYEKQRQQQMMQDDKGTSDLLDD